MPKTLLQRDHLLRSGFICLLISFLAACGGSSSSKDDPVYKVSGVVEASILEEASPAVAALAVVQEDEEDTFKQTPSKGALVTINGIQANSLTNEKGEFTVESSIDFDRTAVITATKDGFESFSAEVTLNSTAKNTYQLNESISVLEIEPWGYLDIKVSPSTDESVAPLSQSPVKSFNQDSADNSTMRSVFSSQDYSTASILPFASEEVSGACDCVMDFSGTALKKGSDKSELYIMLIVDTSGSTNTIIEGSTETIFEAEINALKALVDSLYENEKTYVAVMEFASKANIVSDFDTDLSAVKNALDNITPQVKGTSGAATNYEEALQLTKQTFKDIDSKYDIKTVAFLSDGIPTAPYGSGTAQDKKDRTSAIKEAKDVAKDDIMVNTFPVNVNSKLTTMPSISAITGGLYYQHSGNIKDELPKNSLVGIIGLEVINETTNKNAKSLALYPDGRFEGSICLAAGKQNTVKFTPTVCKDCKKEAYQKIKVSCDVPKQECSTCAGQITNLTLKYTGNSTADIVVKQYKNKKKSYTLFEDTVAAGEEFSFFGASKDKTMGSNIQVYVNGSKSVNADIKTSCGQPKTAPGESFDDFEVIEAYSRNGGLICPLEE